MATVLRAWHNPQPEAKDDDPVLPWPSDDYDNRYEDWHAIQWVAGTPEGGHYVPRDCRSTCASGLWIVANVPTVAAKDFLGRATVATTENYYINTKPALRAAANAWKVRLENGEAKPGETARDNPAETENGQDEKL